MRQAAVFILSDVRSGSTLLDQCLGAHSEVVSLGEVHWLRAYVREDRTLYDPAHPLTCTCGQTVSSCGFWIRVAATLGRPLESLQLRLNFAEHEDHRGLVGKIRRLPGKYLVTHAGAFRHRTMQRLFGGARMTRDSADLYDAVCACSGRPLCVDSSKSPFRFRAVHDSEPTRTMAIVLARDYRAVVYSKMKRGRSLESAARGWRIKMTQIEQLTGDLPAKSVHELKYEALCESPRNELSRLCGFLGIEFEESMLRRPREDVHHIGGSPSKADDARRDIALDRSFEGRFTPEDLRHIQLLVGDTADRWGY